MIGVFGANGFIGRHVTRHLLSQKHEVLAVARSFDDELASSGAKLCRGDLRDQYVMASALSEVDTVVQLMGTSTPAQGNAQSTEHIRADVLPHVDFLNWCVSAGIRRFIFASSGGTVYGPADKDRATTEAYPTNPISSHGVTKLMVEHFIKLHRHLDGLQYVILRIANPYGPGQTFKHGQGLIPALMGRHRQGQPITVYGDGRSERDYVYIDDVVRAFRFAIEDDGDPSLVLNVGSGERHSVQEVIAAIELVADIEFKVQYAEARNADVPSIALDVTRIGEAYGWKPEVDFLDGLRRTLVDL